MALVVDASDLDFDERVIDRSRTVPVVVDFWAPWCGPCRSLGPVLEGLAGEAGGRWELVKVNVDDSPGLAVRYGIQGIPAVKAFREGKEVAQFVGAQPRPQVEHWLNGFLPDPAADLVAMGQAAERGGEIHSAKVFYEKALAVNAGSREAHLGLERIALVEQTEGKDEGELQARLDRDPTDQGAALALSQLRLSRGDEDFGEPLLELISRSDDPAVRKSAQSALLGLLGLLPAEDPRAVRARRSLSSVLYR